MPRLTVLLAPLLFLLGACGPAPAGPAPAAATAATTTTYFLVRHAEKGFGADPALTAAGRQRAERLAEVLSRVKLGAVYSTNTRRTRATAAPAARRQSLRVRPYDADRLRDFSRGVARRSRGKNVLVVGHSNTTPQLANFLVGREELPRFSELDYGNLLVVTLTEGAPGRILQLRY